MFIRHSIQYCMRNTKHLPPASNNQSFGSSRPRRGYLSLPVSDYSETESLSDHCDLKVQFQEKEKQSFRQSDLLVHGYIWTQNEAALNHKINIIPESVINVCLKFYHEKVTKYPDGSFTIRFCGKNDANQKIVKIHSDSYNVSQQDVIPPTYLLFLSIVVWLVIFGWIFVPSIMSCHWVFIWLQAWFFFGFYFFALWRSEQRLLLTNIQSTDELKKSLTKLKKHLITDKPTVTVSVDQSHVHFSPAPLTTHTFMSYKDKKIINIVQWKDETDWFNFDDLLALHTNYKIRINRQQQIYFMDLESKECYTNVKRVMCDLCLRNNKDCKYANSNISFEEYFSYSNIECSDYKDIRILYTKEEYKDWRISLWFYVLCHIFTLSYFYALWFDKHFFQQTIQLKVAIKVVKRNPCIQCDEQ